MNNYEFPQQNIEEIRELLSPYIDGEVTEAEREMVEAGLAALPELQVDLDSLRQTVNLLAALPAMAAPRPFTLAEADVLPATATQPQPKRRTRLPNWMGGLAAAAVAILCVLAAGGAFFGSQLMGGAGSAPAEIAMQKEAAAPQAAQAELAADAAQVGAAAPAPSTELEEEPANYAAESTLAVPAEPAEKAAESAPEALAAAPAPPAPAEMSGAAAAITAEQELAPADEAEADDAAVESPMMAEAAKVAPAEGNSTAGAGVEPPKITRLEATPAPEPTAIATAVKVSSPTPPPTGTAAQGLDPTVPVREVQEPQLIFTLLNLGGILLFSILVLSGLAIMILKNKR